MQDKEREIENVADFEDQSGDVDIDETEGVLTQKVRELKQKLSEVEKEKTEYLTGWQRTKADFVNANRRSEEERSHIVKYASAGLLESLIPVLDSFEGALQSGDAGPWRDGFVRIHAQFLQVLKSKGLDVIDQVGVVMDPRLHESIQMVPKKDGINSNDVVEVLQKGYKLYDRVLRPAKVTVSE
jgi:molecular chaperone GrpE